jgi:hypothetical protein
MANSQGYDGAAPTRIISGSYTGDGGATQVITGVGFKPKFLIITSQGGFIGWKYDSMLTKAYVQLVTDAAFDYDVNYIISFNPNGFTVGNESLLAIQSFNDNLSVYLWVAFQ